MMTNERYEQSCAVKDEIQQMEYRFKHFKTSKIEYEDLFPEICAKFKADILAARDRMLLGLEEKFHNI